MRPPPCFRPILPVAVIGLAGATLCAAAEVATVLPDTPAPAAVEACERSARQAVPASARQPIDVTFNAAPSARR